MWVPVMCATIPATLFKYDPRVNSGDDSNRRYDAMNALLKTMIF